MEGTTDEAVVARVIMAVGGEIGPVYGKHGKNHLLERLRGYNEAARRSPWLILVDLDTDFDCAPDARAVWLPAPAELMSLRIARPEMEAWLLADAEAIADYLGVPRSRVPQMPENLQDAKQALVNLARRSRRRDIREEIVPRESSGRSVGPGYAGRIIDYASTTWRPEIAAGYAPTLQKALDASRDLIRRAEDQSA